MGLKIGLFHLLRHMHKFEASDPRDKAFSLLDLAYDAVGADGEELVRIDYRKSVEEIYGDVACNLIKTTSSLGIISSVGALEAKKLKNLPSWVPDWTTSQENTTFYDPSSPYNSYRASGDILLMVGISLDFKCLRIPCRLIDVVMAIADPLGEEDMIIVPEYCRPGAMTRLWSQTLDNLGSLQSPYLTDGSVLNAFWRTLIADRDGQGRPATTSLYIHFLAFWRIARLSDIQAEANIAENPSRPSLQHTCNDIAERQSAQIANGIALNFMGPDHILALDRYMDKSLARRGFPCMAISALRADTEAKTREDTMNCLHCNFKRRLIDTFSHPIRPDDPSVSWRASDAFIEEYFDRLKQDSDDPLSILNADADAYLSPFSTVCSKRRVFFTKMGLIGVGPLNTAVGDWVVIIPGANVPFILRLESCSGWTDLDEALIAKLMGETYVHGIMYGHFAESGL
jgi:hypothetical protein